MKQRAKFPGFRGFTLLEIFVAIVIVTILAALLVPMAKKMFDASAMTACASNLRTLGQALHVYIADNDGRFPPSRERQVANPNDPEATAGGDHWIFSPYYDGVGNPGDGYRPVPFFSGPKPTKAYLEQQGRTYKDAGIFWCPADKDRSLRPLEWASMSYGVNGSNIGGESGYPTDPHGGSKPSPKYGEYVPSHGRLAAVKNPGEIIFAMDYVAPKAGSRQDVIRVGNWPFRSGSQASGPSTPDETHVAFERHHGKANALFLDGSVRTLTFEDIAGTGNKFLDPALQ